MQPPPIPDENSNPIEVFQYCSYYVRQFFLLYVSPVRDWVYAVAILGCAAVFMWTFLHPQDPDQQYKIVNFLSAWFPFAISIIIALIPDLGTRVKKGWVWRLGVITAGFTYSYLLWHQQGLNLDVSRKDQEKVVTDAVTKANQHTDTKIEGVKTNLEGQGTKIPAP